MSRKQQEAGEMLSGEAFVDPTLLKRPPRVRERTDSAQSIRRSQSEEYPYGMLIIPRTEEGTKRHTTFSQAVAKRATKQTVELEIPSKTTTEALQHIGLKQVDRLQSSSPKEEEGIFLRLDALGMTIAFCRQEKDLVNAINELADQYDVISDFEFSLPSRVQIEGIPQTRGYTVPASRQWPTASGVAMAHAQGIRGAGVLMGVLDTGVDADHAEFSHQTIPYRYVSVRPNDPTWPSRDVRGFDTNGHGTHVCGICCGKNVGVAPEASLYVASVIESESVRTSLTRVVYGLNWLLEQFSRPDNQNKPALLNMSLGFPPEIQGVSPQETQLRFLAIRRLLRLLMDANVLPLGAVGNDGPGCYSYPGGFQDVLCVGAVDFKEQIAPFSGSGSPPHVEADKPDLVGYGVGVTSSIERDYEGRSVWEIMHGSSMATPYCAGIAALYRCQYPKWTVQEIHKHLLETALVLDSQPAKLVGAGLARFV